ncbi:MAG TPA: type II secretion system protein GspF, partial [Gammaproteobacteria bacterium]|nr:type II secretion system protein GspF [Gammaproteobacteria bacterium]
MPVYRYKALDQQGRNRRGRISAESSVEAGRSLRRDGLNPLQMVEVPGGKAPEKLSLNRTKKSLSRRELALVLRQVATMLRSGESLTEVLAAIERQSPRHQRELLTAIRQRVLEGETLAHALARFPDDFKPLQIASVTAGERTGRLDETLFQLAQHVEEQSNLRRNLLLALIYPAVLALAAIGVVVALLVFVMPQLVEVFDAVDMTLPVLTRLLLAVSRGLQEFGGFLLLILLVAT